MNEHIKGLIGKINLKIEGAEKEVKSLIQLRVALQNVCKHDFERYARDHGGIYEQCSNCGMTNRI